MVSIAEKKPKSRTYEEPLVEISEDERDENAQRLLNCYTESVNINGRLRGLMKHYISRIVKNESDQEDILGEYELRFVNGGARTYKYFISESEDLTQNRNFIAWARQSITRVALDFLRRKSRRSEYFFSGVSNEENSPIEGIFPDKCIDPFEETSKNEYIQRIRDGLEQLSFPKRDMLNLFYFNHLDYEEIAKELKIPMGTVKSRLHQSKREFSRLEDIQTLVN